MSVVPADIDLARYEREWSTDLDVLESLAGNGDKSEIPRLVDLSFIGSAPSLNSLASEAFEFGFTIQSRTKTEDGRDWLFLERIQTTDLEEVRQMRFMAMRFEDRFSVECDGWGCVAQDGTPD